MQVRTNSHSIYAYSSHLLKSNNGGIELVKLARRERQNFDCATWLHRARQMPKDDFKKAVEKELTGEETEPWEIVYFKLYQSQMPVIEKAIENGCADAGK